MVIWKSWSQLWTSLDPVTKIRAYVWKETYKRDRYANIKKNSTEYMKGDLYIWEEICIHEKRPMKESYGNEEWSSKRRIYEKRPILMRRDLYMWKATHIREKKPTWMKRNLYVYEKGPTMEIYVYEQTFSKRRMYEKRPTYMIKELCIWKETYTYNKRPIHIRRDLCVCKVT